jgi:hypothetical protein
MNDTILNNLLPGQQWAHKPLISILSRTIDHVNRAKEGNSEAYIQSCVVVGPPGYGKTNFVKQLASTLNPGIHLSDNRIPFYHCIDGQSVPPNPGRTIERKICEAIEQCKEDYIRNKSTSHHPPIFTIHVDEGNHANSKLLESLRRVSGEGSIALGSLFTLPADWSFLFIWTCNSGDQFLRTPPTSLEDHQQRLIKVEEKIKTDLVTVDSMLRRVMSSCDINQQIILLYSLEGKNKRDHCSKVIAYIQNKFLQWWGTNLIFLHDSVYMLAEWDDNRPLYYSLDECVRDALRGLDVKDRTFHLMIKDKKVEVVTAESMRQVR